MTISTISTNGLNQAADTILCGTSGNVGIGTNSPSTYGKLAVSGSIALVPDNNGVLGVGRYSSGYGGSAISTIGGSTFLGIQVEGVEKLRVDSSGNFYFNSGYGSVATAYGCRAWVNFNGTGTVAIRASGNVTSITDNGTGDYTVNFTTAMPDANFAVGFACGLSPSEPRVQSTSTSNTRVQCYGSSGSASDATIACVTVHR